MGGIIEGVNRRTQLVGQNRLELLLFRLQDKQVYGINVFKVREVIHCPEMFQIPNSHSLVCGVAQLREGTIPIIDMSKAIGKEELPSFEKSYVIVTEYNRSIQGFIVSNVDRIINLDWKDVLPAPAGSGKENFLTAITEHNNELVEIIDVEKVLSVIVGELIDDNVAGMQGDSTDAPSGEGMHILVADDSSVARKQIKKTLDNLKVTSTLAKDGSEALDILNKVKDSGKSVTDHFDMVITDIEMPKMDGYTLTTMIKKDAEMQGLYVLLHTSLSGVFNQSMVTKVGADAFVAKFDKEDLSNAIMEWLDKRKLANAQVE